MEGKKRKISCAKEREIFAYYVLSTGVHVARPPKLLSGLLTHFYLVGVRENGNVKTEIERFFCLECCLKY